MISTVLEYANDVNLTVAEVLKKCKELGINVNNANDELTEDDIIMLDNIINLIGVEDSSYEEEDIIDEEVENIIEGSNIGKTISDITKKEKIKPKVVNENNYKDLKKEMYKHKDKLKTNEKDTSIIIYNAGMSVSDLATELNISGTDIIKKLMNMGLMINLNQAIDFETAEILVLDYGKTLKKAETQNVANFEEYEIIDNESDLINRPPIITIMGHVDHGKTTLLDYIRTSHVVDSEFGGITQHIGAYQIEYNNNKLTFIDTPGHAAFTEMRARGASVTDIVIIIVAADDGVMPQTKEAIDHALSANVPIIVAVNKIDKPNSDADKIYREMSENGIIAESWGGNVPFINISAKTGVGVDLLLETILAISEVNGYKANPNRYAVGTVIESKLDKNIGGIATILIQNGTLRLGDPIVVGTTFGKVRTMKSDLGESITSAGPSTPIEITGLNDNPRAGDKFMAFEKESEAKIVCEKRKNHLKSLENTKKTLSLDDLFAKINSGDKEINVVLKCDVRGSEEAVKSALEKINVAEARVKVIRSGIGTITESDVVLASASNAILIGFNVMPSSITKEVAKEYNVEIKLYTIIYKLIEDIELAMQGLLEPTYEEKIMGHGVVRKIFKFSKIGNIAGCYVTDGVIKSNSGVRVVRDGNIIYDGKIASVQREKDTVKEVKKGFECGLTFENFSDIRENDSFETYENVEVKNA